jgi:hypothetical protein
MVLNEHFIFHLLSSTDFNKGRVNMNLEKVQEKIESSEVVEELIIFSKRVFEKSSEDVKKVIESFITKSYLMGKQNTVKTFDD